MEFGNVFLCWSCTSRCCCRWSPLYCLDAGALGIRRWVPCHHCQHCVFCSLCSSVWCSLWSDHQGQSGCRSWWPGAGGGISAARTRTGRRLLISFEIQWYLCQFFSARRSSFFFVCYDLSVKWSAVHRSLPPSAPYERNPTGDHPYRCRRNLTVTLLLTQSIVMTSQRPDSSSQFDNDRSKELSREHKKLLAKIESESILNAPMVKGSIYFYVNTHGDGDLNREELIDDPSALGPVSNELGIEIRYESKHHRWIANPPPPPKC